MKILILLIIGFIVLNYECNGLSCTRIEKRDRVQLREVSVGSLIIVGTDTCMVIKQREHTTLIRTKKAAKVKSHSTWCTKI